MKTIVAVTLNKKSDFYNKYSQHQLSRDLSEYIYNECLGENYKNHIIINIECKTKISADEKHQMMDTIRRTYGLKVQDELYYYESGQQKKILMLLFGLVLIIIYYSAFVSVLREIILILGWLDIWESVYSLMFDSRKDKIHITRLKELAKARIYFNDIN